MNYSDCDVSDTTRTAEHKSLLTFKCTQVTPLSSKGHSLWHILPAKFGVGMPGGAENIVHGIRNLLSDHPD